MQAVSAVNSLRRAREEERCCMCMRAETCLCTHQTSPGADGSWERKECLWAGAGGEGHPVADVH